MDALSINKKRMIKEYITNISKKITIDKVIFFGSGVKNKLTENSDLDYIIISKDFRKMKYMQRLQMLSHLRTGISRKVPMDILAYTPEEFDRMTQPDQSVVLTEAKHEGKIVYSK